MKEWVLFLSNIIGQYLVGIALASFQSSLWPELFGTIPPPHCWLPLIVFLTLYRTFHEGLITVFLFGYIMVNFSLIPLGSVLFMHVGIWAVIQTFKQRVYWPGANYFMLANGLAALSLPLFHTLISSLTEENPIQSPDIIGWVVQMLMTAVVTLLLYPLLMKVDQWTHKEQPTEAGVNVL